MSTHQWQFQRQSGFDQVVLRTADDIRALPDLDQKLWVALASPAKGLEIDARTLALLDTDGDGRIRAPEVIAAIRWLDKVLKDLGGLKARGAALPLAAIREDTPEGQLVLKSARRVLQDLGQGDAKEVSPAQTADTQKIFAETLFNGDGIVTAAAAEGGPAGAAIEAIVQCLGGETDRSGKPGVSAAKVDAFYAELQAYADWRGAAEADPAGVVPLGDATEAAAAAFAAVRAKIEDWFTRCRLAAFDARAGEHLARPAAEWAGIAERSLSAGDEAIAAFPLARIEPGKPLPLADGVNPAWAGKVAAFRQAVVAPLLGDRALLTADQWEDLKRRFAGHEAWLAAKKGAAVEGLGLPRVRALLAGEERAAIAALIAEDEARRPEAEALASVDKAALLYRDFYTFLNNFVSFADFYERGRPAVFQAGTLYLDGRTCDLCLSVADVGKHSAVAGLSHAYLAYCDCTRKGSAEKRTIAVAFTGGDVDFLRVGRNGLFYDRDGVDWDATIVKVVEAPLSIRQAFWSPYKRIGRLITEQIEKFAAAREKQVQASSTAQVTGAAGKVETAGAAPKPDAPKPAAPSFDIAKFAGIFAAIGLAIGAIGAFAAALVTGFLSLKLWQMPLALAGVALLISAPSMLLAWLKLRQRNLAPLLDASGWAINTRARITVPFGATLTQLAALPDGASRTTGDPYAEPTPAWKRWAVLAGVAVVASILWEMGLLRRWLGL